MLVPGCLGGAGPHAHVLYDTLAEPDHRGQGDDQRNEVLAAARTIRTSRSAAAGLDEHAQRNEQVRSDLCVRREHICQQDIPELAIVGLGDAADAHALQGREEAAAARVAEAAPGEDEDENDEDEEGYGEEVVVDDEGRRAVREGPEEEEREGEGESEEEGEAVRGEVVRGVGALTSRGIVDEVRDILSIWLACRYSLEWETPSGERGGVVDLRSLLH